MFQDRTLPTGRETIKESHQTKRSLCKAESPQVVKEIIDYKDNQKDLHLSSIQNLHLHAPSFSSSPQVRELKSAIEGANMHLKRGKPIERVLLTQWNSLVEVMTDDAWMDYDASEQTCHNDVSSNNSCAGRWQRAELATKAIIAALANCKKLLSGELELQSLRSIVLECDSEPCIALECFARSYHPNALIYWLVKSESGNKTLHTNYFTPAIADIEMEQDYITVRDSRKSIPSCSICLDELPSAIFVPCEHGNICDDCALQVLGENGVCPVCRTPISEILSVIRT